MLKLVTAATSLPVTVERAKQRLQIDANDFDNDIEALIGAATAAVEKECGLALQPSSWECRYACWPCYPFLTEFDGTAITPWPWLQIPLTPVRDVAGITYIDQNGAEQTVDPSNYSWERTREGANICLSRNFTLPTLGDNPYPVRVAFEAGYDDPSESGSGDDPELILPAQAEMATLFLVGHWFRTRESVTDVQPYTVPQTFDFLAAQLRVYR